MQEYDLAVVGIFWGTAIAFALWAITMVDSGRKRLLTGLWAIAAAFLVAAIAWPWAAERWPALKAAVENVTANKIAINLMGTAIFCLLGLDFGFRSGWFGKFGKGRGTLIKGDENSETIEQLKRQVSTLQGQLDSIPAVTPYDDSDLRSAMAEVIRKVSSNEGGVIGYQHMTDEALEQIREGLKKFEGVEKNLIRNNQRILGYDQDIPAFMEIVLELLALSILFDAIPTIPLFTRDISDLTHEEMRLESENARAYQTEVKKALSSTQWGSTIRSIMTDAVVLGEEDLRKIPDEGRPNIDPLDLRYYMIARRTCEEIDAFIQSERKESTSKYISYLDRLRQRLWDRKQVDKSWQ